MGAEHRSRSPSGATSAPSAASASSAAGASSASSAAGLSAALSGGVAGCVAKTVTAPLARLTVLAQTSTLLAHCKLATVNGTSAAGAGSATMSMGRAIMSTEGLLAFWKGNMATCLHRFPYTGINFLVVDVCHRTFPEVIKSSSAASLLPGALAGSIATLCCYPLEVVRTRRMTQIRFQSMPVVLRELIYTEGIIGVYRGSTMALATSVPSLAISYSVYPKITKSMSDYSVPVRSFVAGGLAGVLGSSLTFPLDVVRRRMQVMGMSKDIPQRTLMNEVKHIWRAEGTAGFFRGISPELAKVFPSVAITFCTFEGLRSVLLK